MDMVALPFYNLDEKIAKPHGNQYVENPSTLGELIRNKRIELGLFQKDLAQQFEVSEDCVTYWENNRSIPQIKFYPKIIKFLGYIPFEIDTQDFAGKIKMYRYLNGLSYKKMGNIIGVDGSTIGEWGMYSPYV
jgi:DNA-binding XRE family transcriptional regulator